MQIDARDIFLRKSDFDGSTTVYKNPLLRGLRFRLLRDKDALLEPGIEYDVLENGGFELKTFEVGEETIIVLQFY